MPDFAWIGAEETLTPAALTVRAQTISPNDQGRLRWDIFFPRRNVDSTRLDEITSLDIRPAADRREWNQRGRLVPIETPPTRALQMVPIEAYFKIDELEMQKLAERTLSASQDTFRQIIGASIPERSDLIVSADYRRLELDAMNAWATGTIVTKDPQSGRTQTADFGFDAARVATAGTAWNDAGVNAYDEFLAWLEDAIDAVGPVAGVVMRLATFQEIQTDAPNWFSPDSTLRMTRAQVAERVSQEIGGPFRFEIVEDTVEVFDDGGLARTATKVWPAQMVAAIPSGNMVGNTAFAPVRRAMELASQVPGAGIDIRGVTVYHEGSNAGRELTVEAQLNALPIPDEQKVFVIDAGV